MAGKKPHILFVSHKANRSGAPLLLLEIIKEFTKTSGIPCRVLIMNNGELADEFSSLCQTFIWYKKPLKKIPGQRAQSLVSRLIIIARGFYILFRVRRSSVVFFNTIDNGHIHKKLLHLQCKSIYYIHEMEAAIHMLTNKETLSFILQNTHLFLAVSEAVKNNLIKNHLVDSNKIKVMATPFQSHSRDKTDHSAFIASLKQKNGLSKESVIVGVMGQNEWRKGFDLFLPLIKLYFILYPQSPVFFIWKGFSESNLSSFFDLYKQELYGLKDKFLILPHDKDSVETMACMDIHLLLSREDPYPLVMLEAASFGIPTICFSDSGGAPEFVRDDAGGCASYGDLLQMAERIHKLVNDNSFRKSLGDNARQKVTKHAFDKTIPPFVNILESQFLYD